MSRTLDEIADDIARRSVALRNEYPQLRAEMCEWASEIRAAAKAEREACAERAELALRIEATKWAAKMSLRLGRHIRRLELIVRAAILGEEAK